MILPASQKAVSLRVLSSFFGCEVRSVARGDAVWNSLQACLQIFVLVSLSVRMWLGVVRQMTLSSLVARVVYHTKQGAHTSNPSNQGTEA